MPFEETNMDPKSLALYNKGKEILEVVNQIAGLIPDEDEKLQYPKEDMIADAAQLSVKVAGAEGSELYDLKMEAAALIRKAAKDLMVRNHSLEMFGFRDVEYFNIVRELIEEYRLLFIDWIAGFDQWDYMIDRWGLFNPPGVGPFDHDPDEDFPGDEE